jgi:hypothetical protein
VLPLSTCTLYLAADVQDCGFGAKAAVSNSREVMRFWGFALQVDEARQDPGAFHRALEAAKVYCRTSEGGAAPPGWEWVSCDSCEKWRLVSKVLFDQQGWGAEEATFKCSDNTDRPGASCEDPPDTEDQGEGGNGGGEGEGGEVGDYGGEGGE